MRLRLQIFVIAFMIFTNQKTLLSQGLFNGIPYQEYIGARPISMGETFVAIADDINAIYWNPAGLPSLDHLGVNSMRANLFNSGAHHNYIALAIPGFQKASFGVDWMNVGFDDGEFDFGNNKINFSAGYQLLDWISVGANLKYVNMNMALDNMSQGSFSGWGADLDHYFLPYPRFFYLTIDKIIVIFF